MEDENKGLPLHIGIIMDGNRRWAKSKGKMASEGHKLGADTLDKMLHYANKIGIKYLTVYAFSTENWKRAENEISVIMKLLKKYLDDFLGGMNDENIKVNILGDISKLNKSLQKSLNETIEKTKNNTGLTFNIAFNYGGRDEIVRAVKKITHKALLGEITEDDITEELISENLYTKNMPDPDLIIRTSGELRLSGFLIWQSAYSELYFVEKNWPEFTEKDLDEAIEEYKRRNRRFGGK